ASEGIDVSQIGLAEAPPRPSPHQPPEAPQVIRRVMAKRLAQNGIEVGQCLAALDLQTAPELWPIPQGCGEAVDLTGLFRRIGLLWRGVIRLLCQQQHLVPRRTKILANGPPAASSRCISRCAMPWRRKQSQAGAMQSPPRSTSSRARGIRNLTP